MLELMITTYNVPQLCALWFVVTLGKYLGIMISKVHTIGMNEYH